MLVEMCPKRTVVQIPVSDLPFHFKNVKIQKEEFYMSLIFEDQAAACSHNLGWSTDNNHIQETPPHHPALK